ncbi:hypothetical protein [Komagataeibacter rhaeticus]|mgnify:FL=1|uniref:hypothetical protein n=1 Tax=Komagataeibacter rhaeticus TaxID=215221 RepID=UPI0011BED79F|nr:hypothetical protein [Komagataeibacter rhaeticus]
MILREEVLNYLLEIQDGETIPPTNLENIIIDFETQSKNLETRDLTQAAITDLGDVPDKLNNFTLLTPDQILELARRFGWTINALTQWDIHNTNFKIWIECILASVAIWDFNGDFWRAVYPRLAEPAKALQGCAVVIHDRVPKTFVPSQSLNQKAV